MCSIKDSLDTTVTSDVIVFSIGGSILLSTSFGCKVIVSIHLDIMSPYNKVNTHVIDIQNVFCGLSRVFLYKNSCRRSTGLTMLVGRRRAT